MARKITLPKSVDEAQGGVEPIEFEWRGETITSTSVVPASAMLNLAKVFEMIEDMNDDDAGSALALLEGQYEMLLSMVVLGDRQKIENLIEHASPPISVQELSEVITVVTSELLGNPTQPSSDSSPTTEQTDEGSTAVSSQQGMQTVVLNSEQLLS